MIYVVTAVHNRKAITEHFISQLLEQSYKDIRLILVDDGSTDGTSEMVLSHMPDAVIIRGDGNLWWGGALHQAYKWIRDNEVDKSDYVLLANDDTEFQTDYIEKAIKRLYHEEHTMLAGWGISRQTGKQVDGAVHFDFATTSRSCQGLGNGNCASTRSLFFRVEDLLIIGGFHPIILPHYGSDYEWTIRAVRKHNYRIISDPSVQYYVDEETTGDSYQNLTRKKIFSKRSKVNPLNKFVFILLVTPLRFIPSAISNQFSRYKTKKDILAEVLKRK